MRPRRPQLAMASTPFGLPMINITNNIRGNNNTVNITINFVTINLRVRHYRIPIYAQGRWENYDVECIGENDRQINAARDDQMRSLQDAGWHVAKPKTIGNRRIPCRLPVPAGEQAPKMPERGFAALPGQFKAV